MIRIALPAAALLALTLSPNAETAEDRYDTLIVTASPIARALGDLDHSVSLITRSDIELAPLDNLAELLQYAGGVDVRQRGGRGVQADVGIRGTTFEQTLVMIDGVRVSDPQTGHHDMNLPLPLAHIERVEVLKGPGSAAYGPGATGGAINVITRRPDSTGGGVFLKGGENGYRAAGGHVGLAGTNSGHLLSASWRKADGHISDEPTDFDDRSAYYSGRWDVGEHTVTFGAGINERDFGAYKFYVDHFPDQREETRTLSAQLAAEVHTAEWTLTPAVYWRRHEDWFRTHVPIIPADFINEHETDVLGARLGARRTWEGGITALGAGSIREDIESTALGDHDRREHSLWLEHQFLLGERTRLALSGAGVFYSEYSDRFLPGASISHRLASGVLLFASAARSSRVPSYIELFLPGGAGNQGNADLEPERSDLFEAGLRWQGEREMLSAALFQRRTRDLIDWSRPGPGEDFVADNFGGHRTDGGEVEYHLEPEVPWLDRVRLAYTHLRTRVDRGDRELSYALSHPRHEVIAAAHLRWLPEVRQSVQMRYAERRGGGNAWLLASRLAWQLGDLELSLEGNNLLNETFVEAGFAPQPGRWIVAGVAWRF